MPSKFIKPVDEKLIKKVINGDTQAYGVLYERYQDEIYRYVYYRLAKDSLDAEDMTQLAFIRAWNVILQNKTEKYNFRGLIYQIARNLTIDHWRTKKKELIVDEHLIDNKNLLPEQHTIRNEESDDLIQMIRELEPKLQEVIICRFVNGLSHAETACSLGRSEGYVRVLQFRALKKLQELSNEK